MNPTLIERILRYLLGAMLAFFGLNNFFHFWTPPAPTETGGPFLGALAASGYVFPLIGVVFVLSAVLLFVNRAVPFALVLLSSIIVHILAFHLVVDDSIGHVGGGALLAIITLAIAWFRRGAFTELFTSRAPSRSKDLLPGA